VNVTVRPVSPNWQQPAPPTPEAPRARRFSGGRALLPLTLDQAAEPSAGMSWRWRLGVAVCAVATALVTGLVAVVAWARVVTQRGN
jgi:hypothetical protein